MSSVKKITLMSRESESFDVDEAVSTQFGALGHLVKDNRIMLPNVRSEILVKVIDYCKKHANNGTADEELKTWDAEFVRVERDTLFGLAKAAQYLKITPLVNLIADAIAALVRGKTVDQMREIMNIKSEMTLEDIEWRRRIEEMTAFL